MSRQRLVGVAVVAALGCVAAAVAMGAGGIGDGGVISSCYNAGDKGWRPIPNGSSCKQNETLLSWSVSGPQGPPGDDGVSPVVTQLSAGDANCPAGGVAITDAAGTTAYACSGSDGAPGADGEPFSGTFTSPNGQYSISVADTGITLKRTTPGGASIALHDDDITVKSSQTVNVEAGTDLKLKGSVSALVEGGGFATVKAGALTAVSGGLVTINGPGCRPAARLNDTVTSGLITTGSATVCIGG